MQSRQTVQWCLILSLTICASCFSIPTAMAQSGGGSGGGAGGGTGAGRGSGSGISPGTGKAVVPRSKDPGAALVNPQSPPGQLQQRDRAQRLEQELRQGQVNPTTPQTEMSDRLDQLYKNQPAGRSDSHGSGR